MNTLFYCASITDFEQDRNRLRKNTRDSHAPAKYARLFRKIKKKVGDNKMNDRIVMTLLVVTLVLWGNVLGNGQTKPVPSSLTPTPTPSPYSIEGLNLVGAAASMPLVSDSILGVDSEFRRTLFSKGLLLRVNALPRTTVNVLDGPVPANQQVYIGQRPTWITGLNPILTADLRQLGLRNTQLNIGAAWRWTNWNPAGPKTISLTSLYLYKMWREHRIEMKASFREALAVVQQVEEARRAFAVHRSSQPRASSIDFARRLMETFESRKDSLVK